MGLSPSDTKDRIAMDIIGVAFTVLGIAVSVTLFLIGYRQTIGAKKERVRSGNDEIEKILVRRIVLEEFEPSAEEIMRLIDTKARDFRVRATDLLSESQFMNSIYTRIIESDFIPYEQRKEVLKRLSRIIEAIEASLVQEQSVEEIISGSRLRPIASMIPVMAVAASLVGTLLAILPDIRDARADIIEFSEVLPVFIATIAMSIAIISLISVIYRIRERQQEEPSKATALSGYLEFEGEVFRALQKLDITSAKSTDAAHTSSAYDFLIELHGKKILVEVKNWSRNMSPLVISRTFARLRDAIALENASYAVVVTRKKTPTSNLSHLEDDRIKIMTLSEFRRHLAKQD